MFVACYDYSVIKWMEIVILRTEGRYNFVTMMGKNPQIKIYPLYQPIIVSCTVQSLFRLKIVNFIETLN